MLYPTGFLVLHPVESKPTLVNITDIFRSNTFTFGNQYIAFFIKISTLAFRLSDGLQPDLF